MPYLLSRDGKKVLRADGTLVPGGRHSKRSQAVAHLRALYANVPDARTKGKSPVEAKWGKADRQRLGVMMLKAIGKRQDVKPSEGQGKYGNVRYADPTNKKYPVNSEKRVRAAMAYISQAGNAGKYSSGDVSKIKKVIRGAGKKYGIQWSKKDRKRILNGMVLANKEALPRQDQARVYIVEQKDGTLRWVLLSSNSFMDDDKEIISQKALEDDIIRKDKSGDYGPLLWWHLDGRWDQKEFAFRPYVVLGDCDFNAMHGRMLIESGTFRDQRVGARVKERAHALQASLGFLHPKEQPGPDGVLTEVWREERSLLPAGQASNPFTALPVVMQGAKRMIKEKMDQLSTLLGDPELMECVLGAAAIQEEKALKMGRKYKSKGGKKGGKGATKAPSAQVLKPGQQPKEPSTDQHADATVLSNDSDEGQDLDNIVDNVTGKLGLSKKELARLTKAFRKGQVTAIPKKKGLKFIMAGKKQAAMAMKGSNQSDGKAPGGASGPLGQAQDGASYFLGKKKGGRGFPKGAIRKISAGGKKLKRVVKELKELRTLFEAQAQGHSEKEATVYAQFEKALKEANDRNDGIIAAVEGVVKAQKEQKAKLNALSGDLPKAIKELQASASDSTVIDKAEVERRLKQTGALTTDDNPEITSFLNFMNWSHNGPTNGNGAGGSVKTKDE